MGPNLLKRLDLSEYMMVVSKMTINIKQSIQLNVGNTCLTGSFLQEGTIEAIALV